MSNYLDIPKISPVKWTTQGYSSAYNTLSFDKGTYFQRIRPFEEPLIYRQKWQIGDIIYLQFSSQFGPLNIDLLNCAGTIIDSFVGTLIGTSLLNPTTDVYQFSISTAIYNEGYYTLRLAAGSPVVYLVSEPQYFKPYHPGTMLLNYGNSYNREGMIFNSGFAPNFRCELALNEFTPLSADKAYIDQTQNETILSSYPFRQWKLIVGDAFGVPDWVADRLVRILGSDNLYLDGEKIAKADGAKLERNGLEEYPMAGWKVDIREATNRDSFRVNADGSISQDIIITYNLDTALFGDFTYPASSNVVQVTQVG